MTDTKLLKELFKESGVTLTFLAKKLNCSRNRVYAIMDGEGGEVTASEIVCLSECLHLTEEQRNAVFLSKKVN